MLNHVWCFWESTKSKKKKYLKPSRALKWEFASKKVFKFLSSLPPFLPSFIPPSLYLLSSPSLHRAMDPLATAKKNRFQKSFGKWKWYTDCAVGNTLKTYDIPWIKTIPVSPPTCAIDHHCEVYCSSMPSEGADLFKHVRLLVVSSAENLHLVKSSTQPGWGLSFPRK